LTLAEIDLLRERCREVPPAKGDYRIEDYLTNLVVTVVDFQMHTNAVVKAMAHHSAQTGVRVWPSPVL
jgi:hypothetical protein